MTSLPDIIEWVLPLRCTFCESPASSMYKSKDGEILYTCDLHGRSNVIRVDFPEKYPDNVDGFMLPHISEIKWFERLYYFVCKVS